MISRRRLWIDWKKRNFILKNVVGYDLTMRLVWRKFMVVFKTFYVTWRGKLNLCLKFMQCSCLSSECKCHYIFRTDLETLHIFSPSNHWWKVLSSHVKVMMKRLVTTCWSARYEAIRAVKNKFQGGIQTFDSLTTASENVQTRVGAQIILLSIENFFMSHVLLERNSRTNKSHPEETSRHWNWFGCVCNSHRCNQNFL